MVDIDKLKEKVENALIDYQSDTGDVNAGWDVLRYHNQGLLKIKNQMAYKQDAGDYLAENWLDYKREYILLRLASMGYLEYKE